MKYLVRILGSTFWRRLWRRKTKTFFLRIWRMNWISKADEAIVQRIRFQSIRYATCFHTRNSKTKRSRHSGPKPRKTDLGSRGPDKTTFSENEIIFDERETLKLDKLHDDAVVIQLEVDGARLSKILVNTRSSSDVLFY